MVFSSLIFIFVFLPITLICYFLSPKGIKNLVILLASLVFYAWGEPVYIVIMLFSTVFDYTNGILIDKYKEKKSLSLGILIFSCVVNLGILGFFKYYGFLIDNLNAIFSLELARRTLPLPVGISFYTFQTMSYTIDVYKRKVKVQKNIISFGAFVTMFPQLVAGPIVKYDEIEEQLNERKVKLKNFGMGVEIFLMGLAKKVLLANNIGILWTTIKAMPVNEVSVLTAWMGIVAFTFQIYFDFSGYSDMAIGLGKMFGFEFPINFNYPYISKSVTEFWRRWHMSLGSWFREYVYIPLGGNRGGRGKQLRNIFIVWFLTGFWHGANWNFIFWGLYFGVLLAVEKLFLKEWLESKPAFISHIYTMFAVIVGWILFEFENLRAGLKYFSALFGIGTKGVIDDFAIYQGYTNLLLFVALVIFSTPIPLKWYEKVKNRVKTPVQSLSLNIAAVLIFIICIAFLVNESYNPFLYFRF